MRSHHHYRYHLWIRYSPSLRLGDINNSGNAPNPAGFLLHCPAVKRLAEYSQPLFTLHSLQAIGLLSPSYDTGFLVKPAIHRSELPWVVSEERTLSE